VSETAATAAGPGQSTLPAGLEDNFGWLLARCFRAHLAVLDRATADLPHGQRGYHALSGAAHCSARSQTELAKQLGVDRTVMVYLVDDLERAGLVERLPDPSDRRSRLIRSTPAGVERLKAIDEAAAAAEEELLGPLSETERTLLRDMLQRIAANYGEQLEMGGACDAAARAKGSAC
jgi:MarR family transcriptional regulator, transcriptional regulator for hemolysin